MKKFIITAVLVVLVSGAQAQSLKDAGQAADSFIKQAQESLRQNPIFTCLLKPFDERKPSQVVMVTDYNQRAVALFKVGTDVFNRPTACGKGIGSARISSGVKAFNNRYEGYITTLAMDGLATIRFTVNRQGNRYVVPLGTANNVKVEQYRP